jgi:hypothetical protein
VNGNSQGVDLVWSCAPGNRRRETDHDDSKARVRSPSCCAGLRDRELDRKGAENVPGFYCLDQCDEDGTPIEDAPPIRLPSLEEITRGAFSLENLVAGNPEQARTRIRRFLRDGEIRVIRTPSGYEVRSEVFPLARAASNENTQVDQRLGHLQPDKQSNVSSGGTISTLIYSISKMIYRIRSLTPGSRR